MKKLIATFVILFLASTTLAEDAVKKSDLAGLWYPSSKETLLSDLSRYLRSAEPDNVDGRILAIISPHAGYVYSAPVAAYGYKLARSDRIKSVIIVGFSHKRTFDGISIYDRGGFDTPIGRAYVDTELAAKIRAKSKRIAFYPEAFSGENSVEMQIPFIQYCFRNAKIVPIAFGTQLYYDADLVAGAIADAVRDRDDCLIIASSDLSHYHSYDESMLVDGRFIEMLNKMAPDEIFDDVKRGRSEACGILPVTTVLLAAKKLNYYGLKVLKHANSGDTAGDKTSVVGYVSAVIYKKPEVNKEQPAEGGATNMLLNKDQRKRLLDIARESITAYVRTGRGKALVETDAVLNRPLGVFVTIHEKGELRGCIGNMVAQGPLYKAVAAMSIEAATRDPRFTPVSAEELGNIDLEISVLSPLKRITDASQISIPGDGVLVRRGSRSGVYLPQVATDTGWTKEEFLTSLCAHKAGLPPDAWKDPSTELYTFTAEVFGEKEQMI